MVECNNPLVNVHIEKTGGTSVQCVLEQMYGSEHVLLFDGETGTFIRSSEVGIGRTNPLLHELKLALGESPMLPLLHKLYVKLSHRLRNKSSDRYPVDDLPGDTSAVSGHFCADILNGMFIAPLRTIVVREPLERMISQYMHWRRNKGSRGWRKIVLYDTDITFQQYALHPAYQNYQTAALGSYQLKEFDIVGVTHCLDDFIQKLTGNTYSVPHLGRSPKPPDYENLGISQELIEEFRSFHSADYEVYQLAQELVH